ncbi:MAG: phosphatase PAP2 family protein [Megasphaera cerevisiae]|nr:phosphatase PAP2 family protein [Megasphaera cerevisiae]
MSFFNNPWDPAILFWIQHVFVHPTWTPIMIAISNLVWRGGIWVLLGLGLCIHKTYRNTGISILAALILATILGDGIIKHLIMRLRPCIEYPWVPMAIPTPSPADYSFPSGHSFASFASASVLWCKNRYIGIFAIVLAAAVAFSRLYLFVHYPSDVLTGALLGSIIGTISYTCVAAVQKKLAVDPKAPAHNHQKIS